LLWLLTAVALPLSRSIEASWSFTHLDSIGTAKSWALGSNTSKGKTVAPSGTRDHEPDLP
jgi:hypothetical protein